MVVESSRPRREVAVEAVKRATKSLTSRPVQQKSIKQMTPAKKAKRATKTNADSDNDSSELSDEEEEEQDVSNSDEEGLSPSESEAEADRTSDYEEGGKQKRKRVPKVSKVKAPSAKKPRKGTSTPKKPRGQTNKKRMNAGAARAKQTGSKEDLPINEDNKLYNCVKDTEIDLQTTAEEWVASYQDNEGNALAQLVNFIFRSAGCNATIDEAQVLDHDSVADTLDVIQSDLKKEVMPSYPLVSRALAFRRFRRRLSEWMDKLFICADEADIVYDDTMMETLTAWVSAMSSSAFRSLRHTSTFIALLMVEQVNRMIRDNRKEAKAAVNSRDVEKNKGSTANKIRVKDLEAKVRETNQIKKQLDGFQQELLDTVFIHRYRDSDASIRADCIGELGRWMKSYPDQYLSTSYFRYFGWVLSDQSEKVRLIAIKCLHSLYTRQEYTGSIQQFTERFLPRLIEMAVGDVDMQVRISVIATLTSIDQHDVLDEDSRETISSHIFDMEPKVRAAVASFIKEGLDEQMREAETLEEEQEAQKLRWKLLAQLLARMSEKLDDGEQGERSTVDAGVTLDVGASSRVGSAVSAVWEVDEKLQDWTALVELLLYDHSLQKGDKPKGRKKGATTQRDGEAPPNEEYRLETEEETILLEAVGVVLQCLQRQSQEVGKDGETPKDDYSAMTRHLIPIMSKLFKKYKTETKRIAEVLVLARQLKMETYVEFQQVVAFESLWDDVIDQFTRHVEETVLNGAVLVMVAMNRTNAMNNVNTAKMNHLRETIMQGLRESVEGINLESDELEEEQLHRLTSTTSRIKHLIRSIDLSRDVNTREEAEQESQSISLSAWDILLACAKRGLSGAAEETELVSNSLVILTLHVMWSVRSLLAMEEGEERDSSVASLCEKRAHVINIMNRLLEVNSDSDKSNDTVKGQAFRQLVDLHILFASVQASGTTIQDGDDVDMSAGLSLLRLKCDTATQERLASFVESELNRQSREAKSIQEEEDSATEDEDDEEEGPVKKKGKWNNNKQAKDGSRPTLESLRRQMEFISGISHFIGAIRLGIINVRFSVALLSRFGRLGHVYDACLRVLVETIREVGIHEEKPERACNVVLDSLREAHHLYCQDETSETESRLINLAKMLSSSLVVRGAQLAILKKVEGRAVMNLHNRGIRFTFERLSDCQDDIKQRILTFFKVLSQLLVSVEPREAILIKKDMDRLMEEYGVEVPLTSKAWDSLRQYEKRLVTIASKSESVRKHVEANKTTAVTSNRPEPRPSYAMEQSFQQQEGEEEEQDDDDSQVDLMLEFADNGVGDETREEHQMDLTVDEEAQDSEDAEGDDE